MPFLRPDAILLDIDNTLYEYEPCHQMALNQVEQYVQEAIKIAPAQLRVSYQQARHVVHERLANTAASHNRLLYFQGVLEQNGHGMNLRVATQLYSLYWETFLEQIRLFDGVLEFLDTAKQHGIQLGLITDLTADIQFKKIIHLELEDKVGAVTTSEEAGCEKPTRAIFEIALNKFDPQPNHVWMVGDSLAKDIAGGQTIGATTFLKVQDTDKKSSTLTGIEPDGVFESFHELIHWLSNP